MIRPVAYTYQADLYCPQCMVFRLTGWTTTVDNIERVLDAQAAHFGVDRSAENSFDSGFFPKVVFDHQLQGGDRCGACGHELRDAEPLEGGDLP
jgi:hypothetical protein